MTPAGRGLWTALVLCLAPIPALAQGAHLLLTEGIRAYRDLQYSAAGELLQRALDATGRGSLSPNDRLHALMYLGASQEFRDDRNAAVATLRTLVVADPRYQPDSLVFPPRITQLVGEVRQTTKAVALLAPGAARFLAGSEAYAVRAYVTSRHQIEAQVISPGGATVAVLYRGPVEDSVQLSWNGLDSAGHIVPAGRYHLTVASKLTQDQVLRTVRLPLDLTVRTSDTLPWPRAPAHQLSRFDARFLVPGLTLGAGLAVPAAAGSGGARGARITLGVAFATIGVWGGVRDNDARAGAAGARWRSRVAAVQQENAGRRRTTEIVIRAGLPERTDGPES